MMTLSLDDFSVVRNKARTLEWAVGEFTLRYKGSTPGEN